MSAKMYKLISLFQYKVADTMERPPNASLYLAQTNLNLYV